MNYKKIIAFASALIMCCSLGVADIPNDIINTSNVLEVSADITGTWGTASWGLDTNTGVLYIYSGKLDGAPPDAIKQNSSVQTIVLASSVTRINDSGMFDEFPNLTRIFILGKIGTKDEDINDDAFTNCPAKIYFPSWDIYDDTDDKCPNFESHANGWDYGGLCGSGTDAYWAYDNGQISLIGKNSVTKAPWRDIYLGNITSMTTGTMITSIPDDAFNGCYNLTSANIQSSVTSIGSSAFSGCSKLSSIYALGVTSIGTSAFSGCTALFSAYLPKITSIPNSAFYNCSNLSSITTGIITSIGDSAFYNCDKFADVTFDSATTIGNNAFKDCTNMTSISLNKATTIGESAFYNCTALNTVKIPSAQTIGNSAFYNCDCLTSMNIPSSVTSMGNNVFWDCDTLESVTINDDTTYNASKSLTIGDNAFCHCDVLKDVQLSSNVTSIGASAFRYCNNLSTLKVTNTIAKPSKLATIGTYAFADCSLNKDEEASLEITLPSTVTSIGDYAFYNNARLSDLTIAKDTTNTKTLIIPNYAFQNCSNLANVTLSNSVTSIGTYAFNNCSTLPSITIPNSVTSIDDYAFYNCQELTDITIPSSVTSIGSDVFLGCSALTDINVDTKNTNYYDDNGILFSQVNGVKTNLIKLPEGKTEFNTSKLSTDTTYNCYVMPTTVTSTADNSLINTSLDYIFCNTLPQKNTVNSTINKSSNIDVILGGQCGDNVYYVISNDQTSLTIIGEGTMWDYDKDNPAPWSSLDINEVAINTGVTSIGNYAFYGNTSLTSVNLSTTLTNIGQYSFSGCTSLEEINLKNVSTINNSAFNGSGLTSIRIPSTVDYIGSSAFSNCEALDYAIILNNNIAIDSTAFKLTGTATNKVTLYAEINSTTKTYYDTYSSKSLYYLEFKAIDTFNLTNNLSPDGILSSYNNYSKICSYEDYTDYLIVSGGYNIPTKDDITITVGGTQLNNTDWTYSIVNTASNCTDTSEVKIFIDKSKITGDIVITAETTKKQYNVLVNLGNQINDIDKVIVKSGDVIEETPHKAVYDEEYTVNLTADEIDYYEDVELIIDSIKVYDNITAGGRTLTPTTTQEDGTVVYGDYTYDVKTGDLIINSDEINGTVEINTKIDYKEYSIINKSSLVDVECSFINDYNDDDKYTHGDDIDITITAIDYYQILDSNIEVKMGIIPLSIVPIGNSTTQYKVKTNNQYSYVKELSNDITITGEAIPIEYAVSVGNHISVDDNTANYATEYTATLTADTGYTLPEDLSISCYDEYKGAIVKLSPITTDDDENTTGDYIYQLSEDKTSATLTIKKGSVVGNVTIANDAIPNKYNLVTDGLTNISIANENVPTPTQDEEYTITLKANSYYHLIDAITVKTNGNTLTADDYTYTVNEDKLTATLNIKANVISGDVELIANAEANQYKATFEDVTPNLPEGVDALITANSEQTPTYNTDYTTTLTIDGKYQLDTLTIKVGENNLSSDSYSYDDETNKLTINGTSITDDITITATAKIKTFQLDKSDLNNITILGLDDIDINAIPYGTELTLTLNPNNHYELSNENPITVTVGETTINPNDDGTYSIVVTDKLTISGSAIPNTYSVVETLNNIKSSNTDDATYLTDYSTTLSTDTAQYKLPSEITIKVGTAPIDGEDDTRTTLIAGEDYDYNSETGELTIYGELITGTIDIIADGVLNTYTVTIENENDMHMDCNISASTVTHGDSLTITFEIPDEHYSLPSSYEHMNITMADKKIDTNSIKYIKDNNDIISKVEVTITSVTGNVVIDTKAIAETYSVDITGLKNITSSNDEATYGTDYVTTLTAKTGYTLPSTITVSVNGNALTTNDYTYSNGKLTIKANKVTGDITISGSAVINTYTVDTTGLKNITSSNNKATYGTDYTTTLTANTGYTLPSTITVKVGTTTLKSGTDYTYSSGKLTIKASKVTGAITISGSAVANTYSVDTTGLKNITSSNNKATYGTDYVTTLTAKTGYSLPSTITVKVGTTTLKSGTDYTYSSGKLTIKASKVTGAITISGSAVANTYTVNTTGLKNITSSNNKATYGTDYVTTLTANTGYTLPSTITVKVGTTTLKSGTDYTYSSGKLTIKASKVTGAITISGNAVANTYSVDSTGLKNITSSNNKATVGSDYVTTLTPASGYTLPSKITIKVGTTTLKADTDYTYNNSTGKLTIKADKVAEGITITGKAVAEATTTEVTTTTEATTTKPIETTTTTKATTTKPIETTTEATTTHQTHELQSGNKGKNMI